MDNIVKSAPLSDGYQRIVEEFGSSIKPVSTYGCKVNSQNSEDGNLYYILSIIQPKSKITFEMCAGDGIECNSANLVLNHGFKAYLCDGNATYISNGMAYYRNNGCLDRVQFLQGWITRENIHQFVEAVKLRGQEIDLLIIDIDGNDYWILKEIIDKRLLNPRVIMVEYQDIIGPTRALTIPYDPDFNHRNYDTWYGPNYCGASLQAFVQLLKNEYAFVGCETLGFNGYFVRRDELVGKEGLAEMTDVTPCFEHEKVVMGMKYRWPRTSNLEWIDVSI